MDPSHRSEKEQHKKLDELERVLADMEIPMLADLWKGMFETTWPTNYRNQAFWREKLHAFKRDFIDQRNGRAHHPWVYFDVVSWMEVYLKRRELHILPEKDEHGLPPRGLRIYLTVLLYHELLRQRLTIHFDIVDYTQMRDRPPRDPKLAKTGLSLSELEKRTRLSQQNDEMGYLRGRKKRLVKQIENFNRMLVNMALELSTALAEAEKQPASEESKGKYNDESITILEHLRLEINKEFPQVELLDLGLLVDVLEQ